MSHEIRNPLVAIKTFTQLLPSRYKDEEFRNEFKEMVTRELGRLDGIVTQIEGFAHPTASVIDDADLTGLLQEAADGARAATEVLEAQIKFQADSDLPAWRGDRKAMTQCFQHLFINSIEAAARKQVRPQIRVRLMAHKAGHDVVGFRLAFVDNGPGVADEILPSVFSPFCSSKAQGLGLGLPITQRVVLDHGGKIDLDSGTMGLCVNITLPLEPPPVASAPALGSGGKGAGRSLPNSAQFEEDRTLPSDARVRLKAHN